MDYTTVSPKDPSFIAFVLWTEITPYQTEIGINTLLNT